jgi:exonuclease III
MRIVSINTGKGDGAHRRRIELLGNGLLELDPDIVLLQEALKSEDGALDTARDLAHRLGFHPSYAPARFKSREIEGLPLNTWSGVSILSRTKPDELIPVELPMDSRDGDRTALIAKIGNFTVVDLHLTHLHDQPADLVRRRQIETILVHESLQGSSNTIIGGDFNTGLVGIAGLLDDIGDWRVIDSFGKQLTDRATVPVSAPMEDGYCIDFLFALIHPGQPAPCFANSAVVLGEPDSDGIYPSDHRGIMTDVSFEHDLEQAR